MRGVPTSLRAVQAGASKSRTDGNDIHKARPTQNFHISCVFVYEQTARCWLRTTDATSPADDSDAYRHAGIYCARSLFRLSRLHFGLLFVRVRVRWLRRRSLRGRVYMRAQGHRSHHRSHIAHFVAHIRKRSARQCQRFLNRVFFPIHLYPITSEDTS